MAEMANVLKKEILNGIKKHGVVLNSKGNKVLAYEVDGFGNVNMMDDANVPSLLSLKYLGFNGRDIERNLGNNITALLHNTREMVLSKANPYYFEGNVARGIGSPHTPKGNIWHMALSMQGLTIDNPASSLDLEAELCSIFRTFERTDAGTGFTHESFNVNNPKSYTRKWFAWSNSLFSELVLKHLDWLSGGTNNQTAATGVCAKNSA